MRAVNSAAKRRFARGTKLESLMTKRAVVCLAMMVRLSGIAVTAADLG